jgi:hypothetical protein
MGKAVARGKPDTSPALETIDAQGAGPLGFGPEVIEVCQVGKMVFMTDRGLRPPAMKRCAKKNLPINNRRHEPWTAGNPRPVSPRRDKMLCRNGNRRELAGERLQG